MKLKYYLDGKGNAYELKTELEQIMINDIIELTGKKNKLQNIINGLEKFLNKVVETGSSIEQITCKNIFNYLQELKENNNE